ncbi:hypothetical protein GGX14DRAFT_388547 [Mycena pura]|uniref:Uncharacterized protein n=1 Tax=Mycena pura TaxID=153505 RepID=A0AAD6VSA9_9AGAR|nr:hypothetical protein GGX14DRAFT_388547 [Mycena pura]
MRAFTSGAFFSNELPVLILIADVSISGASDCYLARQSAVPALSHPMTSRSNHVFKLSATQRGVAGEPAQLAAPSRSAGAAAAADDGFKQAELRGHQGLAPVAG